MNDATRRARELLDLAEDYFDGGFRRERAAGPDQAAEAEGRQLVEPAAAPSATPDSPRGRTHAATELEAIAREVASCTRCPLGAGRRTAVPGEGVPSPQVVVVGEAPGADEDATGRPFVGAAGQYLDKWLSAVGLSRDATCYIANVIKCRPPGNRDPQPDEVQACRGYLELQLKALHPRAILAVGRFAAQALTGSTQGITLLRTKTHEYRGIPLIATYHPSAVLRDQSLRAPVWEDIKRLKALLGNG